MSGDRRLETAPSTWRPRLLRLPVRLGASGRSPPTASRTPPVTSDDPALVGAGRTPTSASPAAPPAVVVVDIDPKHGADPDEVLPALGLEHHPGGGDGRGARARQGRTRTASPASRGAPPVLQGGPAHLEDEHPRRRVARRRRATCLRPGRHTRPGCPTKALSRPSASCRRCRSVLGIFVRPANGPAPAVAEVIRARRTARHARVARRARCATAA